MKHHELGKLDLYAGTVASVGRGAYLYGESVLAMLALCPTNPARMTVASPRRVRRKLPGGVDVVKAPPQDEVTPYEGIPSQRVVGAIRACVGRMMPERLVAAAEEANRMGLLRDGEKEALLKEVGRA